MENLHLVHLGNIWIYLNIWIYCILAIFENYKILKMAWGLQENESVHLHKEMNYNIRLFIRNLEVSSFKDERSLWIQRKNIYKVKLYMNPNYHIRMKIK